MNKKNGIPTVNQAIKAGSNNEPAVFIFMVITVIGCFLPFLTMKIGNEEIFMNYISYENDTKDGVYIIILLAISLIGVIRNKNYRGIIISSGLSLGILALDFFDTQKQIKELTYSELYDIDYGIGFYIVAIGLIGTMVTSILFSRKSSTALQAQIKKDLEYNDIIDKITDLLIRVYDDDVEHYTTERFCVITAMTYYDEVMNGGLCQFFVNSSRLFAPMLSYSLEQIKAVKHKALFDEYIKNNNIDVNDLSSFASDTVEQFISNYDRYPFNEFDSTFYDIDRTENMALLIVEYARKHAEKVF